MKLKKFFLQKKIKIKKKKLLLININTIVIFFY